MAYPTPPPTMSPKNDLNHSHKIPAQDSYFFSTPDLPTFQPYAVPLDSSKPSQFSLPPQHLQQQIIPPPRIASPLISPISPYTVPPAVPISTTTPLSYSRPYTPPQKPGLSGRTTPPKPIYFSPSNPIPTPYSSSRPQPRPGFRKRMLAKISSWIRSIARWTKNNPIKAGLITFLPVLAAAGITRTFGGVGKWWTKGKEGLDKFIISSRKSANEDLKAKKAGKKPWGWGLDDFVGFNNSKGGPMDGMLKMMQMWVTHICRVSPSVVPRTMAILLDLYFLEIEK